ncbi:UNVERIFIED_CONTAM: hypothetical protein HDU68_003893 [Siphonaria sp. JEL0065]|nr:hypothetical protein HDU68_003893 [Siphonaria sp. JEL0065]
MSKGGIRLTTPTQCRKIAINSGLGRIELHSTFANESISLENHSNAPISAFADGYVNFTASSSGTGDMRLWIAPGVEKSRTEVDSRGEIDLFISGFVGRYYLVGAVSMVGLDLPPDKISPSIGYVGSRDGKGTLRGETNPWSSFRATFLKAGESLSNLLQETLK